MDSPSTKQTHPHSWKWRMKIQLMYFSNKQEVLSKAKSPTSSLLPRHHSPAVSPRRPPAWSLPLASPPCPLFPTKPKPYGLTFSQLHTNTVVQCLRFCLYFYTSKLSHFIRF
ncbi:hypothetical protein AALO_G00104890 [Alosa alosa]|uniref:Uncharacterized protein n=1 Tax=Alosa alosa TaxID=278164 RepID=A0AAV6GYW1_9TELE|nr:hypothetical protein AALO_G00104890 [Alosa alosa]